MTTTKYFPDELVTQHVGTVNGSRIEQLTQRFRYISSFGTIVVHKGFTTDGASVPRIFWNILGPYGDYFKSAVVHDWLYSPFNTEFTRWEADQIFLEAMFNDGVPWYRRNTIYAAVRAFGWAAFKAKPKPLGT